MRSTFAAALLAALVALTDGTAVQAQQGAILARVTEAATARPLPTAQVSVTGNGVQVGGQTNQNGQVRVTVPPGSYTVTFVLIGYATRTIEGVEVEAGQTTDVAPAPACR